MAKRTRISLYPIIVVLVIGIFLISGYLLSGCSGQAISSQATEANKDKQTEKPVELNVAAAISLKDALEKLAGGFEKKEHTKIIFNFASSGDLMTQIEQGAPIDVFISAGKKQMDILEQNHDIDKSRRFNLLGNDLVVVVPRAGNLSISKIEDLALVKGVGKIAIGEPGAVPAGQYAKESLETANIWSGVQDKLVMTKDVRQALNYVETGNVDAGLVYKSDALLSKGVRVALVIPDNYHKPIVYPMAIVNSSHQKKLAAKFEDYLKSSAALKIFESFGFKPVIKKSE